LKVALIYNENVIDPNDVINVFGMTTKEHYSKKAVEKVAHGILVEQFISGREFAVGVIGNHPSIDIFPIVETNFQYLFFFYCILLQHLLQVFDLE
jgi:hypothetical protein